MAPEPSDNPGPGPNLSHWVALEAACWHSQSLRTWQELLRLPHGAPSQGREVELAQGLRLEKLRRVELPREAQAFESHNCGESTALSRRITAQQPEKAATAATRSSA